MRKKLYVSKEICLYSHAKEFSNYSESDTTNERMWRPHGKYNVHIYIMYKNYLQILPLTYRVENSNKILKIGKCFLSVAKMWAILDI